MLPMEEEMKLIASNLYWVPINAMNAASGVAVWLAVVAAMALTLA